MNPYDLHIAFVSWGDDGKRRPVLVLSSDEKDLRIYVPANSMTSYRTAPQLWTMLGQPGYRNRIHVRGCTLPNAVPDTAFCSCGD